MSLPLCKQVGHWRVSKEVIGSGTTSTVVLAMHSKVSALRAAVKVMSRSGLLKQANGDPSAIHLADAVIHREVTLMKLAAHKRIVKLYDFVGHGDLVYMVLEHAPNGSLFDLFRASSSYLPSSLVLHIFSQIMQGLVHTHSLHIVHRDLKLENIFVYGPDAKTLLRKSPDADMSVLNVKIGDFGLSHIDNPAVLSTVFHGSPHYQAPEIWARVPHRPLPTDVWSAGVILYALQCRRLPFELSTLRNVGAIILAEQTHLPSGHMLYDSPESVPNPAGRLISRIFTLDPTKRPTAQGVLDDLYFRGVSPPPEERDAVDGEMAQHADLYDIATLCIPPSTHIARESFTGSSLEHLVKNRLNCSHNVIEKRWAYKLGAYITDKNASEAAWEKQTSDKERRAWTRSFSSGKIKTIEVLGQMETNLAVIKPKVTASLSFRSFRTKTSSALRNSSPLGVTPTPVRPSGRESLASSAVAEELQERREALLKCAYELGFGTSDLRAFAQEAGMIVRVARQGSEQMGLGEIAREMERHNSNGDLNVSELYLDTDVRITSNATTLVPDNFIQGNLTKAIPTMANTPIMKILNLGS